ncbi:MAG TPA: 3-(methylthio)propionyl-CoA ligase [Usitatibacter sp.]|nr:3-(methylthio)propionyl-CoA ligase [Usitatibacter sp.]
MRGLMMDMPLLVSGLIRHADRHHGDIEIVSRRVEGDMHRQTYREAHVRARKLAKALAAMGLEPADRVASLAWNGYRHFELYYAAAGSGMVMHTINPRLFPEQINWIVEDAEDRALFIDLTFVPLVKKHCHAKIAPERIVVMTDRAHMPAEAEGWSCYEDLLAAQDDRFEWPALDEESAAILCYTSGTTGNPKGALYSHRSTLLHAYGICLPDAMGLSARDTVLPIVPMFHVNAWGLPFAAPLVGSKIVFPGAALDGKSVYELFESERVTFSAGVPTVWGGLIQYLKQNNLKLSTLERTIIGGSAVPPAMMRTLEDDYGIEVSHAWGMTEMSPLGCVGKLKGKHDPLSSDEKRAIREKQGRVVYGVDWRIVDGEGAELPWDGEAFGDLHVRGPWVVERYYKANASALTDGWFATGDVATIDPDGYLRITDRSKDVVKSGGEWISSIALENLAMAHPGVQEAAVIACKHPKWDERPLLVVVRKPGAKLERDELLAFYEGKVARWWVPDDVVFVDELPHTATGKLLKTELRARFAQHVLPTARSGELATPAA